MKKLVYTLLYTLSFVFIISCKEKNQTEGQQNEMTIALDSIQTDEYGMHQYVMAFLYKGENRETDSLKAIELQKAHMANIDRLASIGKLSLAGPFLDNGDLRGIYIFNVKTLEEAKSLTESDPAIQSGHLRMELKPWYGSAAVLKINDIHNRLIEN